MPDPLPPQGTQPIQPQGTNPTQTGLSPADLMAKQQAQQSQLQGQNLIDQQKLQKNAEKGIFRRVYNKTIKPGSLIAFQYSFYKHDPLPLVLVGKLNDWNKLGMIAGLNFHYLTYRYMKYLVETYCGKNFNYHLIKGNKYIVNAYRSYKKEGRKNVKVMDCDFLNSVLKTARSFKPSEVEAIRQEVQRQLREKMHPTAEQFAKQYQEAIYKQPHKDYNIGKEQPDARLSPKGTIESPQE